MSGRKTRKRSKKCAGRKAQVSKRTAKQAPKKTRKESPREKAKPKAKSLVDLGPMATTTGEIVLTYLRRNSRRGLSLDRLMVKFYAGGHWSISRAILHKVIDALASAGHITLEISRGNSIKLRIAEKAVTA